MTGLRIALLIGFLASGARLACAEDLTISTYYPSPRGVYQELRTTNNTYLATQAGNGRHRDDESGSWILGRC